MGFSPREKCKQALSAVFQHCWPPVPLNSVLGNSACSSLSRGPETCHWPFRAAKASPKLSSYRETFRWPGTVPFNSIKPSGSGSPSSQGIWCDQVKQGSSPHGLVSPQEGSDRDCHFPAGIFSLGGEDGVGFAAPGFWWMRWSQKSVERSHLGP